MAGNKKKEITPAVKNQIAQFLMANNTNQAIHHGKVTEAAAKFGICKRTVHRVWADAMTQMRTGNAVSLTSNKLGIPQKKTVFLDIERMKSIPFSQRTSIRVLAKQLGISDSQVGRWVKSKEIIPHTNAIKPALTLRNQLHRVQYSLSHLVVDPQSNAIKFSEMYDTVHIDEKWYYMSRNTERYYMVPGEEEPHRTCQSKRFIPKVMFMCAVSRPIFSEEGEVLFDGKIGIWPFTEQVSAQRNSKNRLRGTMFTKPLDSVTKEVVKECMLTKILPAIKAKWPAGASKNIFIQQDNARPHILDDDTDFRQAASSDGFNIKLVCQPPNSPDTNINDLGWFRAIQSLQFDTSSYTVDELVMNVLLSYENLEASTLNKVFLSLQSCLIEVMKAKGKNNYKQPHMAKGRLIRAGRLPTTLMVDLNLVIECIQFLMDAANTEVWSYDLEPLLTSIVL